MDQGLALFHMKGTGKCSGCNMFLNGCTVDGKASLLCEESFSGFNGLKYLKAFQLVILMGSW